MLLPDSTIINSDGHLEIGGCDVVRLADKYSTPLFVYDEATIRKKCREYIKYFQNDIKNTEIIYAGKAFLCKALVEILKEEGLSVDVASLGELYVAIKSGFSADRIYFHGNNKSREELESSIQYNVGRIIIDNFLEMETLQDLAGKKGKIVNVLIRITPGVSSNTHSYIQTGQIDSKFGFGINDGIALSAIEKCLKFENVELKGFHFHIGSQIIDLKYFETAIKVVAQFIREVKDKTGFETEELDVGGGLGIKCISEEKPPSIKQYAEMTLESVKKEFEELNLKIPKIKVEPGRSIIGNSCVTLYSVGTIKEIPGVRKYVSVDGGMADNIRPMLYSSKYDAFLANKAGEERVEKVTISGKHCESGDILVKDVVIQKPETGDILCIPVTGAYCYAMSSNYNKLPKPAVIMVKDGKSRVIIRRETNDDLLYLENIINQGEKNE